MSSTVSVAQTVIDGQQSLTGDSFIRTHLRTLSPYQPILPFEVLSARLGRKPEDIIKLDANENPYGPPPEVSEALGSMKFPYIYPDPESRILRAALAEDSGLGAEHLLVGCGADELIDLIMRCVLDPGDKIVDCPPTFTIGQNPDVDRLSFSSSLRSNPKKKIMVLFCGTNEIKKANAREIYAKLLNKDISSLMLVLQSKINSYAKKELESYPFKVETFHISELLINVTKHVLHPKYQILAAEEKKKLLRKYKVEDKKLPLMLITDAFARYYGLEKGQAVKITYRGGVAGSLATYRCIV